MRIKQMYSRFGWHLKPTLLKKYNLVNAFNPAEPCLFFGMYGEAQIQKALSWRAPIKIWLSGGDAAFLRNKVPHYAEEFKKKNDVTFIATVNFIEEDLKAMDLPYEKIPLFSHPVDSFTPSKLGDSIYIYHPGSAVYCPKPIYNRIREEFKTTPFIEARNHHSYSFAEMQDVYKKSFLSIRLVTHDGLSHGISESGLVGRKAIYNGDTPNAVHWKDYDDVLVQIENVIRNKYNPFNLALKMRRYLDAGDEWLNV